jgi:hypothetical protein
LHPLPAIDLLVPPVPGGCATPEFLRPRARRVEFYSCRVNNQLYKNEYSSYNRWRNPTEGGG